MPGPATASASPAVLRQREGVVPRADRPDSRAAEDSRLIDSLSPMGMDIHQSKVLSIVSAKFLGSPGVIRTALKALWKYCLSSRLATFSETL